MFAALKTFLGANTLYLKLAAWALGVSLVFGGGVWLGRTMVKPQVAACVAARATDNAHANAAAVTGLTGAAHVATVKTDEGTAKITAQHARSAQIMEKVDALPDDHQLGRNPALRVYLDGLRNP